MKHEGGLTRIVETVMERYGQICEVYGIMNQWGCSLTDRKVSMQEGEAAVRDDAQVSGCVYWMHHGCWCNSQRWETQKDHLPERDERQWCLLRDFPCLTIKEQELI